MAEHREFLQARVDDANALLVAGEIAAAAGVNEKAGAESPGLADVVTPFNRDEVRARVVEPRDGKTFAHLGAGLLRVLQQQMIEPRALDLEGYGFPGVVAVAKDQLEALGTVANVELRACFERETFPFERLQHPHVREESAVVGQERLADVKARETLLFQDEDAFAGARQKGGAAAAARSAANHQRVVNRFRHA